MGAVSYRIRSVFTRYFNFEHPCVNPNRKQEDMSKWWNLFGLHMIFMDMCKRAKWVVCTFPPPYKGGKRATPKRVNRKGEIEGSRKVFALPIRELKKGIKLGDTFGWCKP